MPQEYVFSFCFVGFSPLHSNFYDRVFNILVSDLNKTQMSQKSEEMPCKTPLTLPNPLKTSKQKQPSGWLAWVVGPGAGQRANLAQGICTTHGVSWVAVYAYLGNMCVKKIVLIDSTPS